MKGVFFILWVFLYLSCGTDPNLSLESIEAKVGEIACLKVKADLGDMDSFQFSVNWDVDLLEYESSKVIINEPSTYTKINDILHFEGALTMSGSNQKFPLAPWPIVNEELCEVCWKVKAETGQEVKVIFSNYNSQISINYHKGPMFVVPEITNGIIFVK